MVYLRGEEFMGGVGLGCVSVERRMEYISAG